MSNSIEIPLVGRAPGQGCANAYETWKNPKCKQRYQYSLLNTYMYGRHIADDILKCTSLNEIYYFQIKLQWNVFNMVQIENAPALVQVMA